MIRRNFFKSLFFYLLVLIICIIAMNRSNPSFSFAMIVYGDSDILLLISTALFVFLGLFLKTQTNRKIDFVSLMGLGLLLSFLIFILMLDYDYISSIQHQNTPELKIFSEDLLGAIDGACIPLSWFTRLPDSHENINKFLIVFAGIYPTTLLFFGLQIRRCFFREK